MSGGHFDYKQYHINEIIDTIERDLNIQGRTKPKDELYCDEEFYKRYPEEKVYRTYPKEVEDKLKEAVKALKIASIYVQRVDWFLSGDDGEESFLKRLNEELEELIKES